MRIQCIVLEDHGDIPVLRLYVIHTYPVDQQIASGNVLQAGYHTECSGFAAAGRTDENNEFLVRNLKVEVINRYNTFIGDFQVVFPVLGFITLFLLLFVFSSMRIDLLDVS